MFKKLTAYRSCLPSFPEMSSGNLRSRAHAKTRDLERDVAKNDDGDSTLVVQTNIVVGTTNVESPSSFFASPLVDGY